LLLLLCLVSLSFGELYSIEGRIVLNNVLLNYGSLKAGTKVIVNGGIHVGFVKETGDFIVNGLEPGLYQVEVVSVDFIFERFLVEISNRGIGQHKVHVVNPRGEIAADTYPLRIHALAKAEYFTAREGYNLTGMLANPMFIMMAFTLGLGYLLPKMMANIDPETMKEIKEQQQQSVLNTNNNPLLTEGGLSASLASMTASLNKNDKKNH